MPLQQSRIDDLFEALGSRQRRHVLVTLLESGEETAINVAKVATGDGKSGRLGLRHSDLPKLDEYGYVTYDREGGQVRRGPRFEEIRPCLELLRDNEDELPGGWI